MEISEMSDEEFELVLKERFKAYEQEYDAVSKVLEKINKEKMEAVDGEFERPSGC